MRLQAMSALCVLALTATLHAGDWPAFRGPHGNGISDEMNVSTEWSPTENIKWKATLPRPGNGSPIVVKGRVLVNCAQDAEGHGRTLYCFDRKTGEKLWEQTVEVAETMESHKTNPYCGSTPASDGERVVTWHATGGLHCYDLDGKELWSRDLGKFQHMWGYGSSPVIYHDRVLLNSGPGGERVFMAAFDLATGKTLWEQDEPQDSNKPSNNAAGKPKGAWTTPTIVKVDGRDQAICTMPTRVVAYDPQTGEIVWWCDGIRGPRGDLAYSSALIGGEYCVATGGYSGPSVALKLGGKGDLTESHRLWREEKNPQSIGSGVLLDGYVFKPNADAKGVQCLEAATGKVVWSSRGAGQNWGSIVMADGLLFVTSQQGATLVFKPNPEKYEEVAVNKLGEPSNSTPAVSDGDIFIRTSGHLFCIGE